MISRLALTCREAVGAGFIGVMFVATLSLSDRASAYTEKTLYKFCSAHKCKDGAGPLGLAMDQTGNFFGVAGGGGKLGDGVVFEFMPSTGQLTDIHDFCSRACTDGFDPGPVNLIIDAQGDLYGTTMKGDGIAANGVVFELVRKGTKWYEKTLYSFCPHKGCADGGDPTYGLTYAGAGSGPYDGTSPLYGSTNYGGGQDRGTVFSLTPKTGTKKWTEQVLYSFCSQANCADGAQPATPLHIDSQGNLYGTTELGGLPANAGVVFELTPNGSGYVESLPYAFCGQENCADGADPDGGVVMDASGNLYGAAASGGEGHGSGLGVLYKLTPEGSQWTYTNLGDFNGKDGAAPTGTLLLDASGNLFGTTSSGGAEGQGNVFEFDGAIHDLYLMHPLIWGVDVLGKKRIERVGWGSEKNRD